jgi:peptide/nickel transport system permease protein
MLRYLFRRVLYSIPILMGTCLLTFLIFYLLVSPTQLARRNLSARNPTPAQINAWLAERGYDKPKGEQFVRYMGDLLLLRFGKSDATKEDIWEKIKSGVGPSLTVMVPMFLVGVLTAILCALFAAYYRGTYLDFWITFTCVLIMSISYLVYIMAGQYLLGKVLKYFPIAGYVRGPGAMFFILLPVVIGVASHLGTDIRFFRTVMLDDMSQDYVRTARAKGVSERAVLFRHVLKNAAIPIITSTVMAIPYLLMGSLLLESFFAIPGLGTMTIDAIQGDDFATVRAMVYLGTVLYIIGAIMTDLAYAWVNPRVRLE